MWQAGFEKNLYSTLFDYDFEVGIWYPTLKQESHFSYSQWYDGTVVEKAPIAKGQFPLIVFSCGYAGSHYDHAYIAESLARAGFIVAGFSRHIFEKKNGLQDWGIKRIWYRAYEMKLTIQCALTRWAESIEHRAGVSLFGFSAGAFTSLLIAGAVPDFKKKSDFKIIPEELKHYDFSQVVSNKIKNLVLMAPIFSEVFSRDQLKRVIQPTLLLTVEKDEIINDSAEKYSEYLPTLIESYCLRHANHYIFNGTVNTLAARIFPNSAANKLQQELYHPFILNHVVGFFKKQLTPIEENYVS